MVRSGTQRRHDLGRARRVSQAHGQVAQPPLIADAPDRRPSESLVALALRPGEELDQLRALKALARLKLLFRRCPGEAVPGTHRLAVIAAIDAVANERPQLFRDCAFMLDGEIRDAAARIELVRPGDGACGAYVDAALAAAAMLFNRRIAGKRQIGVHLAEKKP